MFDLPEELTNALNQTAEFAYDNEGRVAEHIQNSDTLEAIGAGERTLVYTYDANARRQSLTCPSGAGRGRSRRGRSRFSRWG